MLEDLPIEPILLSLQLATVTTLLLLLLGMPLAWWIAHSKSPFSAVINTVATLPLVLPPSVLGFYLLIALGPQGPLSGLFHLLGISSLTFSFTGLVIGSMVYSLPFMLQPLVNSIQAIGARPMEVAATLQCAPLDAFFHVILPLAKPGIITGALMTFAHTIGEFGVVLLIGGNIPGQTQVVSTQIYTYVEGLEYEKAHFLAGAMLIFSFIVLLSLNLLNKKKKARLKGIL